MQKMAVCDVNFVHRAKKQKPCEYRALCDLEKNGSDKIIGVVFLAGAGCLA